MSLMESDYTIDRTKNGYRVRLNIDDSKHTHLKSKQGAINAVKYVTYCKIPKNTSDYYLISLQRLSTNKKYIDKIQVLLDTRKNKSNQRYYNPSIKK